MAHEHPPSAPRTVWAYAYQIVPPQPEHRLHALRSLLDHERAQAQLAAHTWEGRFVHEQQVTHILVVSDSPELALEANQRVEAELRRLKAGFAVTAPLAVDDQAVAGEGAADAGQAGRTGALA